MANYDPAVVRVFREAGGPMKVARYLGLVPSAVTQWVRVPARHVPRLEALTGIPAREIRPDLYTPPVSRLTPVAEPAPPPAKKRRAKQPVLAPEPAPPPAPKRRKRTTPPPADAAPPKQDKAA